MTEKHPALAVVVKGWPRLSETFIAQELAALERSGRPFDIWSLRFPTDKKRHPLHDQIRARVRYLPEYLHQEPLRVLRAWLACRKLPGYRLARQIWAKDFRRDRTRNRIRRFGQACVMAHELPTETQALYAHFLHTPSSVARYAAIMRAIPWSFSAHAKDIWTSPEWELREKLSGGTDGAAFGVTCTGFGAEYLQGLAHNSDNMELLYHGLDLTRFPEPPKRAFPSGGKFHMMSVGRLVEKKGFDRLIDALALLPDSLDWHWTHIGGGSLNDQMQAHAERLNLTTRITWQGACDQPEVIAAMRDADLFVLPSRIASDGDRDGLPNVLMEAASQMLPILSTPVSAIPEFIDSGIHGLLVNDDPAEIAGAMQSMAADGDSREAMATAALKRLRAEFGVQKGIDQLTRRLDGIIDGV